MMKGGGKKEKKSVDLWESLASESENGETDRSGADSLGQAPCTAALENDVLKKTKPDGEPMNEMVETMAMLGKEERKKMLQWYGETMPKGISLARRELWVLHVRWTVDEGMMTEEAMRDEVRRGVFRDGKRLEETRNSGNIWRRHVGRCISGTPVTAAGW